MLRYDIAKRPFKNFLTNHQTVKELFQMNIKSEFMKFYATLRIFICIIYAIVLCLCYVFMHIYVDLALNYREIRPDHPVLS